MDIFGGRLDFTNGVFDARGFGVDTAEVDVDNVRLLLTGFAVLSTGINISGGSFTYGGFSVAFQSTPVSEDVLLTRDRGERQGIYLARGLAELDGASVYTHDLATSATPTGTFFPAVRVTDGQTGDHWAWAEQPIFVANATAPITVQNVRAFSTPEGIVVTWTPLNDPAIYSYNVLWGDVRTDVGFPRALAADATQTQLLLPSTVPSREYRVNVVALRNTQLTARQLALRHSSIRDAAVAAMKSSDEARRAIAKAAFEKNIGLTSAEVDSLAEQARLVASGLTSESLKRLPEPAPAKDGDFLNLYTAGPLGAGTSIVTLLSEGNNLPQVIGTPVTTATVGSPWETVLDAIDAETHTMTATLDQAPDGMTLEVLETVPGHIRVALRWTPTAALTGRVRVGVEFRDSNGGVVEERFSVFVGDTTNEDPGSIEILSPLPATSVVAGRLYSESVLARASRRAEALRYRLLEGPTGMSISPAAVVSWQTTSTSQGSYPVAIEVYHESEEGADAATLRFNLTVNRSNLLGDVNANGVVEASDKQALAAHLNGTAPAPIGDAELLDLNDDGVVDAADVATFDTLLLTLE